MANFTGKNAANAEKYFKSTGTGTDEDPYIPQPAVTIADGDNAAVGTTTDAPVLDYSNPATVIAALKGIIVSLKGNGGNGSSIADTLEGMRLDVGTYTIAVTPVTSEGVETVGRPDDDAETNPAEDANVIALLKGILTQQNAILAILTDVHDAENQVLRVSTGL